MNPDDKKRAIFFFLLIILLVAGFFFLNSGNWDGASRFTLIADTDPLVVFSIEPESNQAILVTIPTNTMLDVPYGYGNYKAGAVYPLGKLDSKRGGGKLLAKSIESTFGISVDGFWANTQEQKLHFSQKEDFLRIKKSYFSLLGIASAFNKYLSVSKILDTDIKTMDLVRLWNSIRKIRIDQITFWDLGKMNVISEEKLADGEIAGRLNADLLDRLFLSQFQEKEIRAENISIEVINATGQEKVAHQFGRILENFGANIVAKSTAVNTEKFGCRIYTSPEDAKYGIIKAKLTQKYNCAVEKHTPDIAEIKIILGENFIK